MTVQWTAVVLAAGQGTRMKSSLPKVLHPVAGRPLVRWVLSSATDAGVQRCTVIVGHGEQRVRAAVGEDVTCIRQAEQLGTGHALAQAESVARDSDHLLVLNGDVPLLRTETLGTLMQAHLGQSADVTFLTAHLDDPNGYGIVLRDDTGSVMGIVEAADRDNVHAPAEVNAGVYCFRGSWVWTRLNAIPKAPNGEYYITELVAMAVREGAKIMAIPTSDPDEARGINDRLQLSEAERVMRDRIRRRLLLSGVTMMDPATTYIDAEVQVAPETTILPNTSLLGATSIGPDCEIGPNAVVRDSLIGANCKVTQSTIEDSTLEDGVDAGPYSHLRNHAHICQGVHIGNFGEVKNSRLGPNTKMGHFSYVGDAEVGRDVNIGAGTITCNYDGVSKHRTVIGDGAFIGSDTMLVAPVNVGPGAKTGAGSVVNHDVPAGATAVGAPARIIRRKPVTTEGSDGS